ncbi:MAG: hypothetical protein AB1546_15145 [bacterium]
MKNKLFLIIIPIFTVFLSGCGGGGGGGGKSPLSRTVTVKGRVVAPYCSDSQFASRLIESADGLDLDGIPLATATITIEGTNLSTATDSMGNFTLTKVPMNRDLVLTAVKGGLVLYKGLPPLSADHTVNINYETTTAYLYYKNITDKMPQDATIEWLEDGMTERLFGTLRNAANEFRRLAQQYGAGESNIPPHLHTDFTSRIDPSVDALPPYLENLTFTPNTITGGQTLSVTATVFDISNIKSMSLTLQNKDDTAEYWEWTVGNQPRTVSISGTPQISTQGNTHVVVLTKTIPETFPSGTYFVNSLSISDEQGNYARYTGSETTELSGSWYEFRDLSNLTITAAETDTTPPELISATLNGNSLATEDDSITLTIVARDSQGELTNLSVSFDTPAGGSSGYYYSSVNYDSGTGNYTYDVIFEGHGFNKSGTGTCYIKDIYIQDTAGNVLHDEPQGLDFEVTVPQVTQTTSDITLESFFVSKKYSASTPVIEVYLTASYSGTSDTIYAGGALGTNSSGNLTYLKGGSWSTNLMYDSITGKWEGSTTVYLNDFQSGKNITLYQLQLNDMKGSRYYRCYYAGECNSVFIQELSLPAHTKADSTSPALTSFSFSPSIILRGENLDITLTAAEGGAGLKDIYLFLNCSGCSGKNYYSIYIDRFTYAGGGVWQASFSMPFPSRIATGTWQFYLVKLTDFADNSYTYDQSELGEFTSGITSFTVID